MNFFRRLFSEKEEIEIINFEKLFVLLGLYVKDEGEKKKVIYQVDYMDGGQTRRHQTKFNKRYIAITNYGYIERFRMPYTLSKDDILGLQEKLELQTNKSIDIDFYRTNHGAYFDIRVYSHKLKERYDFELIEPANRDGIQVTLGYGRLGLVGFDIKNHLGIFGQTGSGKSTMVKTILTQLVLNYRADELQLYLSDNKGGTELNVYSNLAHCKAFVKDISGLKNIFQILMQEAERRYQLVFDTRVEDIQSYNLKFKKKKLPAVLLVIEEFVAIYRDKTIQELLQTALSQWRSVNIFVLITTQRPSAKILTGELKCNLGSVIGLKTLDSQNSNVVIDRYNLLNNLRGSGHAYLSANGKLQEFQGFYINHEMVKRLIRSVQRKEKVEDIEVDSKTKKEVSKKRNDNVIEMKSFSSNVGEVKNLDFLDDM